jgi:hypothetical protein
MALASTRWMSRGTPSGQAHSGIIRFRSSQQAGKSRTVFQLAIPVAQEESSEAEDFYQPTHTKHLYQDFPEAAKLLGLPPGHRFILAGEYMDVWFDPTLLDT